jgi:uncharacterized membrane protein YgdD (TMEM256/DUF423 family)
MGAAGVALAAAAAHAGGSGLDSASLMLLVHAAVVAALARPGAGQAAGWPFLVVAAVLALGASLFAGDLAARAFAGGRLFPMAAPAGGLAMIAGWLALAATAILPITKA